MGDGGTSQTDCSPQTAREIDNEVKKLLDAAYLEAKAILTQQREKLELVAQELIKRETLDAATFRQLLNMPPAPFLAGNKISPLRLKRRATRIPPFSKGVRWIRRFWLSWLRCC